VRHEFLAAGLKLQAGPRDLLADEPGVTVGARRGPRCACRSTPVTVKAEIARRAKNGESPNAISTWLVNSGHGIGRAGVTNHVRKCLGVAEPDGSDPATRSVLLAEIVARLMTGWAGRLDLIAHAAQEAGLTVEAALLQGHVPETMRTALAETAGSPAGELLEARALALACSRVLRLDRYSDAARALAVDLSEQGADELAAALFELATRANTAPTDQQPERVGVRLAAGLHSPAAANQEETA
jgi:hypothetical protein